MEMRTNGSKSDPEVVERAARRRFYAPVQAEDSASGRAVLDAG